MTTDQFVLADQLESWALEWDEYLEDICRLFTGEVRPRAIGDLKQELHEELILLARETPYSGHDLAQTLRFLLQTNRIQGRLGKVILEFTHEWVLPQARQGVKDLFPHISFGFTQNE